MLSQAVVSRFANSTRLDTAKFLNAGYYTTIENKNILKSISNEIKFDYCFAHQQQSFEGERR